VGEQDVAEQSDDDQLRAFMKALLDDVRALEQMLANGMIESGQRRIGAEQEMFLVDASLNPSPVATEVLATADDPRLTTELARFNLEANLDPLRFGGSCLSQLEASIKEAVGVARAAANQHGADILLTGILPTLRKSDLSLDNMTPMPRYFALNKVMHRMRGRDFHVLIKGLDELDMHHDNVMLEACNTSFQIHFQVGPEEFAKLYNVAQVVTGPVLAAAVNSPVLLGSRLWSETRVALFQHSVDVRQEAHKARAVRARVSFGDRWVDESVLEIFREDIARFRVVLARGLEEDPLALIEKGIVPQLEALRLHSGTIYRWNRACYGVHEGVAHLRIENRALPAGPTVLDEVANAALYFGLLAGVMDQGVDPASSMEFDDAKKNFFSGARHGLEAQMEWVDGKTYAAGDLLREALVPLAREGLRGAGIDASDVTRYLDVIEERVASMQTGAKWILGSLAGMRDRGSMFGRCRAVAASMLEHQRAGEPVHRWQPAELAEGVDERENYMRVEQYMTTDLLTVHPEDLVDLAASLMEWEVIRHVPVEDEEGNLVGLVSHRALVRLVARGASETDEKIAVRDIMRADPVTVMPQTLTVDVIRIMREQKLSCLPVVDGQRLVGIVTEADLINVSSRLLEAYLQGE
jgi:CBS domain-containing protein